MKSLEKRVEISPEPETDIEDIYSPDEKRPYSTDKKPLNPLEVDGFPSYDGFRDYEKIK